MIEISSDPTDSDCIGIVERWPYEQQKLRCFLHSNCSPAANTIVAAEGALDTQYKNTYGFEN